ncbi:hypothetical protein PV326_011216, partial [Microctonus aethiopoides]
HWKGIFEKYNLDGDEKIYNELNAMIRDSSFNDDIPPRVVRIIMHKADLNESGYLEYPKFIAMTFFNTLYINTMVPQRPTLTSQQSTRSFADSIDGQYEEVYSCRPPAIAIIIISIIEVVVFLYDVISQTSLPSTTLFIYNPYKRYRQYQA